MDVSYRMGVPDWEFRLVFGRTQIGYDPDKEAKNRRDHHISLESAVALLERLLMSPSSGTQLPFATSDGFVEKGETRHMHLCVDDDGKVLLMVTTMRDDETVRVISIRHADPKERQLFRELTGYKQARRVFDDQGNHPDKDKWDELSTTRRQE